VTTRWTLLTRAWAAICLSSLTFAQAQPPVRGDARRLEIDVEVRRGEAWIQADPATVFDSGAELRFRIRSNFPSRLTLTNVASSGATTILYPSPESGPGKVLEPGQQIQIPGGDGAFRISGPAGYEVLYWIATPWTSPLQNAAPYIPLAPPPPSGSLLHTLVPRCDDGILMTRGDCLDLRAGARRLQPPAPIPHNSGKPVDLRARDLDFVPKSASNAPQPAGPASAVVYELRIAHR
jgi:hypothetical protein